MTNGKRFARTLWCLGAGTAISLSAAATAQPAIGAPAQPAQPSAEPSANAAEPPSADQASPATPASDIVVTGTRIRGIAPVGSAVIPLGQAEIARTSVTSTTDLLRQIPQINSYGADESTVSGGTTVQGSTLNNTFARGVNLRGLGTTATLALIDGHRIAQGGQTGQLLDLDSIPQAAIAQVEVVADGASAIYGSDAVAGVINFVLRRKFDGAESSARYGFADGTDQYVLSQTFGRTYDTGSFFIAYEHQRRNPLAAGDRPNLYNDDVRPFGGSAPPAFANPGNVVINNVSYPIPSGQNGQNVTLGQLGAAGQPNLQSIWLGQQVLPRQTRNSVLATFNKQLSDNLEFFADGLYSHRSFSIAIAAQNSGAAGFVVPASNPFSPCAAGRDRTNSRGIVCPANGNINVQYSFIQDIGNAVRAGTSHVWSLRAGFNIDLPGTWKATVSGSHSENFDTVQTTGNINQTAITAALAGSAAFNNAGVTGTLVRPADVAPLNLFCGGTACNNAATIAFIGSVTRQPAYISYDNVNASADGTLFSLPGGDVRVALGAEYRHDSLKNINEVTPNASPLLHTINITGAKRRIVAGYAELYVPIFGRDNAVPGIEKLELSLAGRIEDYSDFGTTKNPKVGLNWTPVDGVRVRASYGKSFRAPTLSDIDPTSTGVLTAVALTAAQAAQLGLGSVSTLTTLRTQGGTAGIDPERARTFSVGVDFSPRIAPGFTASLNYYNIVYKNRIDSPALNAGVFATLLSRDLYAPLLLLNPNYFPGSGVSIADFNARATAIINSPRPVFTGAVPALGNIVAIVNGNRDNTGTLKTEGLDFSARYVHDAGPATVRAGVIGTYVFNYRYGILPGAPLIDYVNQFSALGSPLRFRARSEFGIDAGGFSLTTFVNYQNRYRFPRSLLPAAAPTQYEHVRSNTTVDLTASYDTGNRFGNGLVRDLRLSVNVQNLFDRDPPLVVNAGGNPIRFDPTNAGALGRLVSIQLSKKW